MFSVFSAIAGFLELLSKLLGWKQRAEDRQAGRDEVTAKVNSETLETKDAMDSVARPTDDDVASSLRSKQF